MPKPKLTPKPKPAATLPPKGAPKQKVNSPGSRNNGFPVVYKQPSKPKGTPKRSGAGKPKIGDLVRPANPDALSDMNRGTIFHEVDGDKYPDYILPDGSVVKPPRRKRTY